MKTLPLFLSLGALLFLLSACGPSRSYFTQELYDDNRWTESDLSQIQFYLSRNIVLWREINSGSSEILRGKVRVINGRQTEEIIIRAGTPGTFIFSPKYQRLAVSFERAGDSYYLMFGPNPNAGNRYVMLASNWERRVGTVTYGGKLYRVSAEHALASLMVDLRRVQNVQVASRTATGRRVQ